MTTQFEHHHLLAIRAFSTSGKKIDAILAETWPPRDTLEVRIAITDAAQGEQTDDEQVKKMQALFDATLACSGMPLEQLVERVRRTLMIPTTMNHLFGCDWNDISATVKSGQSGLAFFGTGKRSGQQAGIDAARDAISNLEEQGCNIAATTGIAFVIRRAREGNATPELKGTVTEIRRPFPQGYLVHGYAYDGEHGTVEVDILAFV